jgi:hypothetical protein
MIIAAKSLKSDKSFNALLLIKGKSDSFLRKALGQYSTCSNTGEEDIDFDEPFYTSNQSRDQPNR